MYTLSCTVAYISLIDRSKRQKGKYCIHHAILKNQKINYFPFQILQQKLKIIEHQPAAIKKDLLIESENMKILH